MAFNLPAELTGHLRMISTLVTIVRTATYAYIVHVILLVKIIDQPQRSRQYPSHAF